MIYKKTYNSPKIDKNEVLRYAKACADDATLMLLDKCVLESEDKLTYNVCYGRFDIKILEDECDLGFCRVKSHSLALCLGECSEIIVFGATVGSGIDRLISKYSIISPSTAVMLQALGSERVEALCDSFCREMAEKYDLRPRFSPGYGDLPLHIQRDIFDALRLTQNLGINLNDNLFMTPTKSVTAIVGIKRGKNENS
jgi:hypothetical protein